MKQGMTSNIAARAAAFCLALLCLASFLALPASAAAQDDAIYPPPLISSSSALVYNLQYDKILFEKSTQELIYPASFAKLMTAILCYEYRAQVGSPAPVVIDAGMDLTLNGIGLKIGESYPFDTLLAAMVIGNANDATAALARTVAGTESAFVARMNERAKELGAENTNFTNPTGLHDGAAHTTLYDMAKICKRAYELNDYMQTSSLLYYEIAPTEKNEKTRRVTNANLLLNPRTDLGYYVEGAMGINLGYTQQSGYCLASVRETGGAINLVLVSGGYKNEEKQNGALLDAMELFAYAEEAYELTTVLQKGNVMKEAPVKLADSHDHVLLVAGSDISALLPVGYNSVTDIEQRLFLSEETLTAPIVEGTSYGSVEIYYKGTLVGTSELLAQRSIARSTSLYLLNGVEEFLRLAPVRVVLISSAVLIVIFLVVCVVLLLIQRQKKNGLSFDERRALKQKQNELILKEKLRQQEYVYEQRRKSRARRQKRLAARQKELEEERKRAELARRRAGAKRAANPPQNAPSKPLQKRANTRTSAGEMPAPAAGHDWNRPTQKR